MAGGNQQPRPGQRLSLLRRPPSFSEQLTGGVRTARGGPVARTEERSTDARRHPGRVHPALLVEMPTSARSRVAGHRGGSCSIGHGLPVLRRPESVRHELARASGARHRARVASGPERGCRSRAGHRAIGSGGLVEVWGRAGPRVDELRGQPDQTSPWLPILCRATSEPRAVARGAPPGSRVPVGPRAQRRAHTPRDSPLGAHESLVEVSTRTGSRMVRSGLHALASGVGGVSLLQRTPRLDHQLAGNTIPRDREGVAPYPERRRHAGRRDERLLEERVVALPVRARLARADPRPHEGGPTRLSRVCAGPSARQSTHCQEGPTGAHARLRRGPPRPGARGRMIRARRRSRDGAPRAALSWARRISVTLPGISRGTIEPVRIEPAREPRAPRSRRR